MTILFAAVFIISLIVGVVALMKESNDDCHGSGLVAFAAVGLVITLAISGCMGYDIIKVSRINPEQIAILEEENADIETRLVALVEGYQQHEEEIYTQDVNSFIMKYPELYSSELVQSLMETEKANHDKIVELKLEITEVTMKRWWLYFGG